MNKLITYRPKIYLTVPLSSLHELYESNLLYRSGIYVSFSIFHLRKFLTHISGQENLIYISCSINQFLYQKPVHGLQYVFFYNLKRLLVRFFYAYLQIYYKKRLAVVKWNICAACYII